ncbi:MAG: hypothetical protein ILP11_00680 [Alphaproteobacteria bacterium]|nr:hypothetical protein [Alphaproteobacteria bacterium]
MNKTQSGRSMLEMLAVLCVIGVLTVGVLLGYRQGMIRYKTYRTHVELSEMVDGIYRVCNFWSALDQCAPSGGVSGSLTGASIVSSMINPFGKDYNVSVGSGAASQTISTDVETSDVCNELKNEDWPAGVDAATCSGSVLTLKLEN